MLSAKIKEIGKRCISFALSRAFAKRKKELGEINTILVVHLKPLGIGDLLMNTPSFRALRKKFPNTHITLWTDRDILNRSKLFDKITTTPEKYYDLVILPNKNLRQSLKCFQIKWKYIVGYLYDWTVRTNFRLEYTSKDHYYNMSFNAINLLGIKKINWKMEKLHFNKSELDYIKDIIHYKKKGEGYCVKSKWIM
jgi:ADP-heptose:LPS heptosyltransferase